MHKRAVTCNLCGKAFFPASIKIHTPQCQKKQALIPIPCRFCDREYRGYEMSDHLKSCRKAKEARRNEKKGMKKQQVPDIATLASPHHSGQTRRDRLRQRSGPLKEQEQEQTLEGGRIECSVCGRGFSRDRIAVHQNICRKNNVKKKRRGVFDAAKQRLDGTEMGLVMATNRRGQKGRLKRQSGKRSTLRSTGKGGTDGGTGNENWKEKSSALRKAIKHAKMVTKIERNGGDFSMLPPAPPQQEPSDFIPCPHCGRTFNPQAGERHIIACARTINKPKMLLRGGQRVDPRQKGAGRGGGNSRRLVPNSSYGGGRAPMIMRKKVNGSFGSGRAPIITRNKVKSGRSGISMGRSGMVGGGISLSNATSRNNPLVTNIRQTFDKQRFR